jgi:periplasmic protein TonB
VEWTAFEARPEIILVWLRFHKNSNGMETLLKPSYCDAISENRNKSFGQYELRTRYPDRILRASVWVITSFASLAIGGIWLSPELKANEDKMVCKPELRNIEVELPVLEILKEKTDEGPKQEVISPPSEKVEPQNKFDGKLRFELSKDQNLVIDSVKKSSDFTPFAAESPAKADPNGQGGNQGGPSGGAPTGTGTGGPGAGNALGSSETITDFAEKEPEFESNLESFLAKSLRYPDRAIQEGIEGQVFVCFVVDETGKVTRPEVLKGIGYGCDEEAIRVINSLPRWKPGEMNGHPVKVRLRVPFRFRLAK